MRKKSTRLFVADALILAGGAAVSVGVGIVNTAAGIIVGGALAIVTGIFINRGANN